MSDGVRDMMSRGPLALHQPEALNAAVCLGVQLGQAPGAEEEAGAHAGVPAALAKESGATATQPPACSWGSGVLRFLLQVLN